MKPLVFISCPIDTFSGYGARSRDIALAIIKSDKYDVKIISQRWGATPVGDATLTTHYDTYNFLSVGLNINIF